MESKKDIWRRETLQTQENGHAQEASPLLQQNWDRSVKSVVWHTRDQDATYHKTPSEPLEAFTPESSHTMEVDLPLQVYKERLAEGFVAPLVPSAHEIKQRLNYLASVVDPEDVMTSDFEGRIEQDDDRDDDSMTDDFEVPKQISVTAARSRDQPELIPLHTVPHVRFPGVLPTIAEASESPCNSEMGGHGEADKSDRPISLLSAEIFIPGWPADEYREESALDLGPLLPEDEVEPFEGLFGLRTHALTRAVINSPYRTRRRRSGKRRRYGSRHVREQTDTSSGLMKLYACQTRQVDDTFLPSVESREIPLSERSASAIAFANMLLERMSSLWSLDTASGAFNGAMKSDRHPMACPSTQNDEVDPEYVEAVTCSFGMKGSELVIPTQQEVCSRPLFSGAIPFVFADVPNSSLQIKSVNDEQIVSNSGGSQHVEKRADRKEGLTNAPQVQHCGNITRLPGGTWRKLLPAAPARRFSEATNVSGRSHLFDERSPIRETSTHECPLREYPRNLKMPEPTPTAGDRLENSVTQMPEEIAVPLEELENPTQLKRRLHQSRIRRRLFNLANGNDFDSPPVAEQFSSPSNRLTQLQELDITNVNLGSWPRLEETDAKLTIQLENELRQESLFGMFSPDPVAPAMRTPPISPVVPESPLTVGIGGATTHFSGMDYTYNDIWRPRRSTWLDIYRAYPDSLFKCRPGVMVFDTTSSSWPAGQRIEEYPCAYYTRLKAGKLIRMHGQNRYRAIYVARWHVGQPLRITLVERSVRRVRVKEGQTLQSNVQYAACGVATQLHKVPEPVHLVPSPSTCQISGSPFVGDSNPPSCTKTTTTTQAPVWSTTSTKQGDSMYRSTTTSSSSSCFAFTIEHSLSSVSHSTRTSTTHSPADSAASTGKHRLSSNEHKRMAYVPACTRILQPIIHRIPKLAQAISENIQEDTKVTPIVTTTLSTPAISSSMGRSPRMDSDPMATRNSSSIPFSQSGTWVSPNAQTIRKRDAAGSDHLSTEDSDVHSMPALEALASVEQAQRECYEHYSPSLLPRGTSARVDVMRGWGAVGRGRPLPQPVRQYSGPTCSPTYIAQQVVRRQGLGPQQPSFPYHDPIHEIQNVSHVGGMPAINPAPAPSGAYLMQTMFVGSPPHTPPTPGTTTMSLAGSLSNITNVPYVQAGTSGSQGSSTGVSGAPTFTGSLTSSSSSSSASSVMSVCLGGTFCKTPVMERPPLPPRVQSVPMHTPSFPPNAQPTFHQAHPPQLIGTVPGQQFPPPYQKLHSAPNWMITASAGVNSPLRSGELTQQASVNSAAYLAASKPPETPHTRMKTGHKPLMIIPPSPTSIQSMPNTVIPSPDAAQEVAQQEICDASNAEYVSGTEDQAEGPSETREAAISEGQRYGNENANDESLNPGSAGRETRKPSQGLKGGGGGGIGEREAIRSSHRRSSSHYSLTEAKQDLLLDLKHPSHQLHTGPGGKYFASEGGLLGGSRRPGTLDIDKKSSQPVQASKKAAASSAGDGGRAGKAASEIAGKDITTKAGGDTQAKDVNGRRVSQTSTTPVYYSDENVGLGVNSHALALQQSPHTMAYCDEENAALPEFRDENSRHVSSNEIPIEMAQGLRDSMLYKPVASELVGPGPSTSQMLLPSDHYGGHPKIDVESDMTHEMSMALNSLNELRLTRQDGPSAHLRLGVDAYENPSISLLQGQAEVPTMGAFGYSSRSTDTRHQTFGDGSAQRVSAAAAAAAASVFGDATSSLLIAKIENPFDISVSPAQGAPGAATSTSTTSGANALRNLPQVQQRPISPRTATPLDNLTTSLATHYPFVNATQPSSFFTGLAADENNLSVGTAMDLTTQQALTGISKDPQVTTMDVMNQRGLSISSVPTPTSALHAATAIDRALTPTHPTLQSIPQIGTLGQTNAFSPTFNQTQFMQSGLVGAGLTHQTSGGQARPASHLSPSPIGANPAASLQPSGSIPGGHLTSGATTVQTPTTAAIPSTPTSGSGKPPQPAPPAGQKRHRNPHFKLQFVPASVDEFQMHDFVQAALDKKSSPARALEVGHVSVGASATTGLGTEDIPYEPIDEHIEQTRQAFSGPALGAGSQEVVGLDGQGSMWSWSNPPAGLHSPIGSQAFTPSSMNTFDSGTQFPQGASARPPWLSTLQKAYTPSSPYTAQSVNRPGNASTGYKSIYTFDHQPTSATATSAVTIAAQPTTPSSPHPISVLGPIPEPTAVTPGSRRTGHWASASRAIRMASRIHQMAPRLRAFLYASSVVPGSPAEQAGLRAGDVFGRFGIYDMERFESPEGCNSKLLNLARFVSESMQKPIEYLVYRLKQTAGGEDTIVEVKGSVLPVASFSTAYRQRGTAGAIGVVLCRWPPHPKTEAALLSGSSTSTTSTTATLSSSGNTLGKESANTSTSAATPTSTATRSPPSEIGSSGESTTNSSVESSAHKLAND